MVDPLPPGTGGNNQEKLQIGELDASASYRVGVSSGNLPYIALPRESNLSGDNVAAEHPDVSLSIHGKTYRPKPLVFYAAKLTDAANSAGAGRFVDWLRGGDAQTLLRKYQYDSPGGVPPLNA